MLGFAGHHTFLQCLGHKKQLCILPGVPRPLMTTSMCILELQSSVSYSFTLYTSKDCFVREEKRSWKTMCLVVSYGLSWKVLKA